MSFSSDNLHLQWQWWHQRGDSDQRRWCYPCVCASQRAGLSGVYLQFPGETLMLCLKEDFIFHQALENQTQKPTFPYFWHVVFANICCFNHKWQPNSNLGCLLQQQHGLLLLRSHRYSELALPQTFSRKQWLLGTWRIEWKSLMGTRRCGSLEGTHKAARDAADTV